MACTADIALKTSSKVSRYMDAAASQSSHGEEGARLLSQFKNHIRLRQVGGAADD